MLSSLIALPFPPQHQIDVSLVVVAMDGDADFVPAGRAGRQTMIERKPSRLELILAEDGQRREIGRHELMWTATERSSPTALHVIIARDLDALERKIIEAELPS